VASSRETRGKKDVPKGTKWVVRGKKKTTKDPEFPEKEEEED